MRSVGAAANAGARIVQDGLDGKSHKERTAMAKGKDKGAKDKKNKKPKKDKKEKPV